MTSVVEESEWLGSARRRLGWTAADVARCVAKVSAEQGRPLTVSQQAVSSFENGTTKKIPRWYRFARAAIEAAEGGGGADAPSRYAEQTVMLPVSLPPEYVLADMYRGMMLSMPSVVAQLPEARRDELARELARLLPSALARLKGPFRYQESERDGGADDGSADRDGAPPARRRA